MTLQTDFLRANLVKAVCSNAVKQCEYRKITVRPVESGGRRLFQAEKLTETKAFHENFATAEAEGWLQKKCRGTVPSDSFVLHRLHSNLSVFQKRKMQKTCQ